MQNRDWNHRPHQNGGRTVHDYGRTHLPSERPAWTIWWPVAIFAGIMVWTLLGGLLIHFMGF